MYLIQFGPMHHWRAKVREKTVHVSRYYLTGFESSCYFPPSATNPYMPEQQDQLSPYDTFPADVHSLENTIGMFLLGLMLSFSYCHCFIHVTQRQPQDIPIYGLQFLAPLLQDMTRLKGNRRPTMEEIAGYDGYLICEVAGLSDHALFTKETKPRRIHHWGKQIL